MTSNLIKAVSKINFSKYSGCGNDFILIDNRKDFFPKKNKDLIQNLCRRSLGIGADGIILLEESTQADYRMRIFNSDGLEAEMCGNGIRCLALFINEIENTQNPLKIEVTEKTYFLNVDKNSVSVEMPPPSQMEWDILINYNKNLIDLDYLDTGVPHVVSFVNEVEKIDLKEIGPFLRYHSRFSPRGTNVNFASIPSNNTIKLRTHERGVEGETFACGTGAAATAIAAHKKFNLVGPINIITRSGEKLVFQFDVKNCQIEKVIMKGPAIKTYSGIVEIENY